MVFCMSCGTRLPEDARFCAACGTPLAQPSSAASASNGGNGNGALPVSMQVPSAPPNIPSVGQSITIPRQQSIPTPTPHVGGNGNNSNSNGAVMSFSSLPSCFDAPAAVRLPAGAVSSATIAPAAERKIVSATATSAPTSGAAGHGNGSIGVSMTSAPGAIRRTDVPKVREVSAVIEGIKAIYKNKILPLERLYNFDEFLSPPLTDTDFDAKPMVLLLGQYSTGKTSFIQYLVGREFPGSRVGPEPTTDRFVAIMDGPEKVTPGNAAAVQTDKPFSALTKFGMAFLNKFEVSQCKSPILEKVTFIDTPGVLSGEKQRMGRAYDFTTITKHFAERADRILLLFDAHKLDISDEFKASIESLRGHDDKIRCVLNKADMVNSQQLMRVYGALMWALGKVVLTPEVLRVYLGSFWDKPLKESENKKLFESESADLLADLRSLPRNSTVRKVNELVKRARMLKVHVYIINHLRNQFGFFGKEKTQQRILTNLLDMFKEVQRDTGMPMGDFPNLERFRESLKKFDIKKFPKLEKKRMDEMDAVLSVDIPELMRSLPGQDEKDMKEFAELSTLNPFSVDLAAVPSQWAIDAPTKSKYDNRFAQLELNSDAKLSGTNARTVLMSSGVDRAHLRQIWALADCDQDGWLDADEYAVAQYLIDALLSGVIAAPPLSLPLPLVPPSKRHLFTSDFF